MVTRDPRHKLVDGFNLQISGIKMQDAGDYMCQIGDQESRDQVHTLEILVPPSLRAIPQTGQVTARKGSTVTLECKASGNPVPTIYWSKKVCLNFFFFLFAYICIGFFALNAEIFYHFELRLKKFHLIQIYLGRSMEVVVVFSFFYYTNCDLLHP